MIGGFSELLDKVAGNLGSGGSWGDWTGWVHTSIETLAPDEADRLSIKVGAHGANPGGKRIAVCRSRGSESEFLFDQCWLIYFDRDNGEDDGYLTGCLLAVETEWHGLDRDPFHRDFQKLIVGKATNKVFVFEAPSEARGREVVDNLKRQIGHFRAPYDEEQYLLSFFCRGRFHHSAIQMPITC